MHNVRSPDGWMEYQSAKQLESTSGDELSIAFALHCIALGLCHVKKVEGIECGRIEGITLEFLT